MGRAPASLRLREGDAGLPKAELRGATQPCRDIGLELIFLKQWIALAHISIHCHLLTSAEQLLEITHFLTYSS